MQQVEMRMDETNQRVRERGNYIASSGREKMTGRLTSKQKSGNISTPIFKSNRSRCKGRSKGEKSRIEIKKQPSR